MMKLYTVNPNTGGTPIIQTSRTAPVPGPREVLIRIHATSINFRDLLVVDNAYGKLADDLIPLSDGAGEIVAVGKEVTTRKAGDRVAGAFYPHWISGPITLENKAAALGATVNGVLAEYVVLPEQAAIPIPSHMSFEEGATLPCAALTAWNALTEIARVRPGDVVLLLGSGGVSVFALQFAKLMGATVIHTSGDAAKCARLRTMGADEVINYRETEDWDAKVLALTNGRGADYIIEVGGPGTLERSFRAIRIGGTIITIGFVGGGSQINPRPIISRAIRLEGLTVGSADNFVTMNRALDKHGIRPAIDRVIPFENAASAYALLRSGGHFGKIVIAV